MPWRSAQYPPRQLSRKTNLASTTPRTTALRVSIPPPIAAGRRTAIDRAIIYDKSPTTPPTNIEAALPTAVPRVRRPP